MNYGELPEWQLAAQETFCAMNLYIVCMFNGNAACSDICQIH
jgi:hypothetical protein